jgi:hypothetical protein
MRGRILLLLIVGSCACGGGGGGTALQPIAPQPQPPPPPPGWVLAGAVVDTLSGAGISGATLTFSGRPAITTSADGGWELTGTGTVNARLPVTIEAPGYVARQTGVSWTPAGRRDIRLDLIADRAPFALSFYRELVRNGFERPDALEPVRRWTKPPNFYVNTHNPRTGQPLAPSEVALIQDVIRDTIPQLTGGQFAAGTIEIGPTSRELRPDFINVNFVYEPSAEFCGRAVVGANPGEITINYERCRGACGQFTPDTVAHEIGHAMGYWHTAATGIMYRTISSRCSNTRFSPDELLHARVAYARPPGNRDTDVDPDAYSALEIGTHRVIVCRRERP